MPDRRQADIDRFYSLLAFLRTRIGDPRCLQDGNWEKGLPDQGVYFFFEEGETRARSTELRVVRVGTVKTGKLINRLRQHHRDRGSSAFRERIGEAMVERYGPREESERNISEYIGQMPFLWVKVDPSSARACIEIEPTALLSNYQDCAIDKPSKAWLGCHSPKPAVRKSGLWSVDYVDDDYEPYFLDRLEYWINRTEPTS